jgi:hypothetical protein
MNETRRRAELQAVLASTVFVHFRPEKDSIVRVQVARLRRHLRRCYETDDLAHPIQIQISLTGYTPNFVYAATLKGRAAQAADRQNGNGGSTGGPADSLSLETSQPPDVLGKSNPAILSASGTSFKPPSASCSNSSKRKLARTLAVVAIASILVVVGAAYKHLSVTASAKMPTPRTAPPGTLTETKIRVGVTSSAVLDVGGAAPGLAIAVSPVEKYLTEQAARSAGEGSKGG